MNVSHRDRKREVENKAAYEEHQRALKENFKAEAIVRQLAREIIRGDPDEIMKIYDQIPDNILPEEIERIKARAHAIAGA